MNDPFYKRFLKALLDSHSSVLDGTWEVPADACMTSGTEPFCNQTISSFDLAHNNMASAENVRSFDSEDLFEWGEQSDLSFIFGQGSCPRSKLASVRRWGVRDIMARMCDLEQLYQGDFYGDNYSSPPLAGLITFILHVRFERG